MSSAAVEFNSGTSAKKIALNPTNSLCYIRAPFLLNVMFRLNIPDDAISMLWQQAQHLLSAPHLTRFFDATQYRSASNEMPYVNASGELKRIDRLVEFDDQVWVLDYKLSDSENASRHHAQVREYQAAMQSVYADKKVRCALLFADGTLSEI